ncbi:MAG TPA: hypothetical protein PLV22_03885 [Candidatus Cloacimonadota bacterium]|nr:hypothetical protein [Candidatus Cloacimonadota bacterium]
MKRLCFCVILIFFILQLNAQSKNQNINYNYLKSIFPSHLVLSLENKYYLFMPHQSDMSADLVFQQNSTKPFLNTWEMRNDYLVYPSKDSVSTAYLTNKEAAEMAPIINALLYKIKCIGTPLFAKAEFNANAETWLIKRNEGGRTKEELPSLNVAFNMLNNKWKNRNIYLRIADLKKANGHLEFHFNVMALQRHDNTKDFLDIRFHADIDNKIDLVMLFLYEDIKE